MKKIVFLIGTAGLCAAVFGDAFSAREHFSSIEFLEPPPSWGELFEKPALRGRFADIVHGAYGLYDWVNLVRRGAGCP